MMVKLYKFNVRQGIYVMLDRSIVINTNKIKVECWELEDGRRGYFPPRTFLYRNSVVAFAAGELRVL